MLRAIPDAHVTDYADLIPRLSLPDPDDRHVLAAAIAAEAEVIVTFNLKDFPAEALAPHGLTAQHPDQFLMTFAVGIPARFLGGVRECFGRLTNPPVSAQTWLAALRRLGLMETAAFLMENQSSWCR